jgi:hypothetical protein
MYKSLVYDFGFARKGEQVPFVFEKDPTSTEVAESFKPSCGCTTPDEKADGSLHGVLNISDIDVTNQVQNNGYYIKQSDSTVWKLSGDVFVPVGIGANLRQEVSASEQGFTLFPGKLEQKTITVYVKDGEAVQVVDNTSKLLKENVKKKKYTLVIRGQVII